MCSIAASMTTMAFNKLFIKNIFEVYKDRYKEKGKCLMPYDLYKAYQNAIDKGAMFDARCFNIPREEVTNYIYWRQLDATRNSIQMVGQANFSHNELQNKSCNDIQDMLMTQKGINWNDYTACVKRGTAVFKNGIIVNRNNKMEEIMLFNPEHSSREWIIDCEMPQLKGENREYVERLIKIWQ